MKHQKDTGDGQEDKEETGDPAQTEGVRESKPMALHFHRKNVKEEIGIHGHGPFEIRVGYSGPEDGAPYG